MVTTVVRERNLRTLRRARGRGQQVESQELLAFCPKCKTLEVLYTTSDRLVPTRRFSQSGEAVYHNCGANEPCRLYRF